MNEELTNEEKVEIEINKTDICSCNTYDFMLCKCRACTIYDRVYEIE